eukprot:5693711-Alexandrium_andersonii.AAC.1
MRALSGLRALYRELEVGHFASHDGGRPARLLTDTGSLVDAVSSDVGRARDRRAVSAALRESMDEGQIGISW